MIVESAVASTADPTTFILGPPLHAAVLISVVTTVRNEERNLAALLDSLLVQEGPFEVIVVDAYSDDKTFDLAELYAARHPNTIFAFQKGGSRGVGRNAGFEQARGERIAFIDGDCIASPGWLKALRAAAPSAPVLAGRTVLMGYRPFAELSRVELHVHGADVSYPSSNLMYDAALLRRLKGFDPRFATAEDIDLNFRAVESGVSIAFVEDAVVYARARDTFFGFFRQAFWNGYGRKQLTLKHGALWGSYSLQSLFVNYTSVWYAVRLALGFLGYLAAKVQEAPSDFRTDDRGGAPPTSAS